MVTYGVGWMYICIFLAFDTSGRVLLNISKIFFWILDGSVAKSAAGGRG